MEYLTEVNDLCSRGYVEVDRDAVVSNLRRMKALLPEETKLLAVVKTDGYGHGSVPLAHAMEPLDFLFGYATATAEEAFGLRSAGIRKPILVLGYTFPYAYEEMARQGIRPALFREDQKEQLAAAARAAGVRLPVHIKVDTGMSRIGVRPDRAGLEFAAGVADIPELVIEGIFTHFARADEADKSDAERQLEQFTDFVEKVQARIGCRIPIRHCANSAAALEMPQAALDMVRAGISMYGLAPSEEIDIGKAGLVPALSLHSRIVYVKTIPAGTAVSYGGTFVAPKQMRIATIPIGYGDGYPRMLSGRGAVLICGRRAPILGRVCMDQFLVDVTEICEAGEGTRVTLLGFDGEEHISAEEIGNLSGRFNYELVCDLGKRLPRVYPGH